MTTTAGGFDFGNVQRNLQLEADGVQFPKTTSTGTTIVGVVFEGGVVLGADTRATSGDTVADKKCQKIHFMAPNIRCCGAGTAADTEMLTLAISSQLTLLRMESGKQTRVIQALTALKRKLYRYQGHIGAALVLGGVDVEGPFLATVAPHGSTDRLPFVAMGSGSIAAMAVLEAQYRDGMDVAAAKKVVREAISAGIMNDPYSGSQVDMAIITPTSHEMIYGETVVQQRVEPKHIINFPKGAAPVEREEILKLVTVEEVPLWGDAEDPDAPRAAAAA